MLGIKEEERKARSFDLHSLIIQLAGVLKSGSSTRHSLEMTP